jgi:hypothetical protein
MKLKLLASVGLASALVLPPTALVRSASYNPTELAERTVERRAVEAVIWGMPAVNFDLMCQAMVQTGGTWNQIVY